MALASHDPAYPALSAFSSKDYDPAVELPEPEFDDEPDPLDDLDIRRMVKIGIGDR